MRLHRPLPAVQGDTLHIVGVGDNRIGKVHSLAFADLIDGNVAFDNFRADMSRDALKVTAPKTDDRCFKLRSVAPVELPAIFEACHRSIWKAEKRSPASAFYEFSKVMFVKLDEDRRLREYMAVNGISDGAVPADAVRFSVGWIERMENTTDNPIDAILFTQLTKNLETQIAKGEKKRIFELGEGIQLAPETVKAAVSLLQHLDLYTVDDDLNGRLFETFLTATMRGKALGQFFTPRAVVKFMVQMAKLRSSSSAMDVVLDGCCGTGGFLIEAMAVMTDKVNNSRSITATEKGTLLDLLRKEALWGIAPHAGKDPQMARIARLNMLLHKDGGSRIYFADALDKRLDEERGLPLPIQLETDELRTEIVRGNRRFSCILSNPPFSMTYEQSKPNERTILRDYELATDVSGKLRSSLRSSVMFLERYHDLLTDNTDDLGGGRLVTIMDESVLNTLTSRPFREYLLDKFILRAVIALPRNTFVKAQGSVKTSVIYLRKRAESSETQADVFMSICTNVGHSDSGKERSHLNQLPQILSTFNHFESLGALPEEPSNTAFLVSDVWNNNPTLRLDAHFFDPQYFDKMDMLDKLAKVRGWRISRLGDLLRESKTALAGGATPRGALYPDDGPKFVRVQNVKPMRLEWNLEMDPCIGTDTHDVLRRSQLNEGDVVLTITGTYGIAAVVPKEFSPANINQHSVKIEVNEQIDPGYLCLFLNSNLCKSQLDRAVTGSSRLALDYPAIKALRILYPPDKKEQKTFVGVAEERLTRSTTLRNEAAMVADSLSQMLVEEDSDALP